MREKQPICTGYRRFCVYLLMASHRTLDQMLGIDYPVIVAPMFLISNTKMIKAALASGVTAAFPALNYRSDAELRAAIREIKEFSSKPFGVNLIVNKSNPKYKSQLRTLLELKVDYIITSLGSPKEVIDQCKPLGIKVFCDVIDLAYAKKVEQMGADALIAVNSRAGGHAGNIKPRELITLLKENCSLPIISAGGIATGEMGGEGELLQKRGHAGPASNGASGCAAWVFWRPEGRAKPRIIAAGVARA